MEIEIINIKKKEGEMYLISKCIKPTQQETPLIARDSDAMAGLHPMRFCTIRSGI